MPKTYINFSVQILNWKHIFHFQFRFWTESHSFSSDSELKTKNTFSVQILNWKPHFSVQILNWKPKIYFQFRFWTQNQKYIFSSDSELKATFFISNSELKHSIYNFQKNQSIMKIKIYTKVQTKVFPNGNHEEAQNETLFSLSLMSFLNILFPLTGFRSSCHGCWVQPKMDRQWMQIKTIARNVACFLPDDNSKTIYVFMKKN